MTTTVPAGLGLTLGVSEESTFNTELAPARWLSVHPNETLARKKTIFQSKVLHGGISLLGARRVNPWSEAGGKFTVDFLEKGMGLLLKHMVASSPTATQQGGSAAYLQRHVFSESGLVGKSLCFQKAVPEVPSGTIVPFTYPGSKIVDWQLSCKVGENLQLEITIDSVREDTAFSYTAASFVNTTLLHFGMGSVFLGGTPSTSAGVTTIASGAAPTGLVTSVMLKGQRKLNTKRVNIGASTKSEQLENDFMEITGELEIEYATPADFYTAGVAETQQPIEIKFTDPTAIASTYYPYVDAVIPNAVFGDASPQVTSADVVKVKVPFDVLSNGTDPLIEIDYMSRDTSV